MTKSPLPESHVLTMPTSDRAHPRVVMLQRIRSEYLEMPGLRLTGEQVERLCGVDRTTCRDVLDALVDMKFLSRKSDGAYARVADGPIGLVDTIARGASS